MKKSKRTTTKRQPRRRRSRKKESTTESPRLAVRNFREQLRESLLDQIRGSVAATARQLVEDEVQALVGEPWSRKGASPLRRGGSTETRIFLGGEPVMLQRTRVRDQDANTERPLETVDALRSRDGLDEEVKKLLIRGVSDPELRGRSDEPLGRTGPEEECGQLGVPPGIPEGPGRPQWPEPEGLVLRGDLHRWPDLQGSHVCCRAGRHPGRQEADPRCPGGCVPSEEVAG